MEDIPIIRGGGRSDPSHMRENYSRNRQGVVQRNQVLDSIFRASLLPTQLNVNHEKGDRVMLQAIVIPLGH